MSLQNQVGIYYSPAVVGDRATQNPVVYTQTNPRAEGDITIGNFVFAGTDKFRQVKASTTGTDAPVGFAERILTYYNFTLTSGATLVIPDTTSVTIAIRGDFWCKASNTTPVIGQKAFASTTDGSVQTAAAGATVAGYVETSFEVKFYDADSGLTMISNWSVA